MIEAAHCMQKQPRHYFVYIFGEQPRSDLNIGVSENLQLYMQMQDEDANRHKLVYYEHYDREEVALVRERHIKACSPEENSRLVESMNPNWLDLTDTLY